MDAFAALGVTSFDSTSAFRQAFMDDRKNYHTRRPLVRRHPRPPSRRQPDAEASYPRRQGEPEGRPGGRARALKALRAFDGGSASLADCLQALRPTKRSAMPGAQAKVVPVGVRGDSGCSALESCPCSLCRLHGVEIAIFRGTERNKRRGFHNLSVLAAQMEHVKAGPQRGASLMADQYEIRLPALRIRQGQQFIYAFGVDGKRIHDFTTVSRVHREDAALQGYQRPEVLSHIRAIRRYLESDGAMLPNAVVLAFDERVIFETSVWARCDVDYVTRGELVIPVDESLPEDQKPAWLVDGQQRSAAIRDADLAEFAVAAVGFIAHGEAEQRSQFILVNNTKPLPKGLSTNSCPTRRGTCPRPTHASNCPPQIMLASQLRRPTSRAHPFASRIATPTMADGYIKDNSVLKMIENSLYDGALYQYRDPETVRRRRPDGASPELLLDDCAVGLSGGLGPPTEEVAADPRRRHPGDGLRHGRADGRRFGAGTPRSRPRGALTSLRDHCAWTSGTWDLGGDEPRRWNGLQNTPNDVRVLTSHLLRALKKRQRSGG